MRVECEGSTAAWLAGTLVAPSVQGHGLPPPRGLCPYQSLFSEPLVAGDQMAFFASFSVAPSIQALRGLPCLGSFSVVWCLKHIEGRPWLGSYSVARASGTEKGTLGGVLLCSSVRQAV